MISHYSSRGVLVAALLFGAATARAQNGPAAGNCAVSPINSCQAKVDLFDYIAPQVGTLVTGGNATLGQGGTLNGFGRFVITLGVNAVHASLPDFRDYAPSTSGAPQRFDTHAAFTALPVASAAFGVYAGYPLGVTRVGGLDLLADGSWLPELRGGSTGLELPNGGAVFGYGARLGLLQEGLLTPGVGVTWRRSALPTMAIHGNAAGTTLRIDDIDLATASWRLTASKSLIAFGVAAGLGRDRYRTSGTINKTSGPSTTFPFQVSQRVTRTSYFADVSMNLLMAKIVAEIGRVSGGKIETYNSFAGSPADASRLYGSLGVRFGI